MTGDGAVPQARPESLGLDAEQLERALALIARGARAGAYAGAVALVGRHGRVAALRAWGQALQEGPGAPIAMTTGSIFDLASLTKVVATLPSVLRLVDAGEVLLDAPVGRYLPEFGTAGGREAVTVRRLLSHTGGLPAWRGYYLDWHGPAEYLAAICREALEYEPGTQVVYSDLGFILLGELVRRVSGLAVDAFAARELFAPLGMDDTGFRPDPALRPRIAATERGNAVEYGMCGERAATFGRWRRAIIHGEANDGNCFYGLDGVSGHAGLFGTATDLFRYACLWLGQGNSGGRRLLSPAVVHLATETQAPRRGLGWQLRAPAPEPGHPAGELMGARSYGHTGFTGTSLWLDPDQGLVTVLLTNRLHPEARQALLQIRPAFHNAVAAAVLRRT